MVANLLANKNATPSKMAANLSKHTILRRSRHSAPAFRWNTVNLNETNCSRSKFSLINMYKNLLRYKLENEALLKKGKLRTFYS